MAKLNIIRCGSLDEEERMTLDDVKLGTSRPRVAKRAWWTLGWLLVDDLSAPSTL